MEMGMWILLGAIVLAILLIKKIGGINIVVKRTSNSCSLKTKGEVIEIIREPFNNVQGYGVGNYDCLYIPVIKYNVNGLEYTKKMEPGLPIQVFGVGDYLDIYVDPNDPDNFCIKNKVVERNTSATIKYWVLVLISVIVVISVFNFFLNYIG